ncbi:rab effector MyRIP isoform X2 [Pimephales promelas]|uniref:rab effector MyRIP isoform X2 n=1 Tax=Pimephales promelas TaxID=90988 RepID=UPI001955C83F|nr:rab effector MyRIP isoform X2 [Pimephales promelas]
MGRKLDLSGLSNDEAEHVLRVVQRDMDLRKKEEERLSEMKQELEEEGSRCLLLSKQHKFNEHCCIRCCSPFAFLLNPKRPCLDCHYNVCKSCRTYSQSESGYICAACQKSRLLRTQSLEWYYNNVKSRFKRFGSAKVLKTLYRKHIIERGALSELPEVSAHEGSNENGSVCDGSDSTLYRQSEGHSMADTLTVALRVAEEAIEEAIAKAESYKDSLEKQNEARYLRDHKEELIEELATTIVQKIIQRGKRSEVQAEYEFVWPQNQSSELPSSTSTQHTQHSHTTCHHGAVVQADITSSYPLLKSRSAFSLTSDDSLEKDPEVGMAPGVLKSAEVQTDIQNYSSLRRESRASSLPGWKSVDRLDNTSASSVLQSPDGNWIALQSFQHSRPSLLTKRKSLVFSVLEKESGVVSAYDGMGSDSDPEDQGGWGAALLQFRRRLSDETYYTDSQHDPEWTYTQHPPITSPSSGQYTNTETLNSDSETSPAPSTRASRAAHSMSQRKKGLPEAHLYPPYRHPTSSVASPLLRPEVLDVNFNPRVGGDSSDGEEQSEQIKRSRRRRKSKRETSEHSRAHDELYSSATVENSAVLLNAMMIRRQQSQESPVPLNYQTPDTVTPPDLLTSDAMTLEPDYQSTVAHNSSAASLWSQSGASKSGYNLQGPLLRVSSLNETLEHELRSKFGELVGQVSERDVMSSNFEPIMEVGNKQKDRLWENESEKLRPKERRESKREKKEGKPRETEKPNERQSVRDMDTSDAVRQMNRERELERERERQKVIERQVERERERQRELEKQIEKDRERQREIEVQVVRKQERQREMEKQLKQGQEKQSEVEQEIKRKRKSIRMEKEKLEPKLSVKSKEEDEQEGPCETEGASSRVIMQNNNLEEDNNEKDKEKVKRMSLQRSKSETGSETQEQLETKTTRSSTTSPDSAPCSLEEEPSEKYSAASLCSITTEVLKVLNATEELLGEAEGKVHDPSPAGTPMSSGPGTRKLDQHLTKMEENVYLAAGAVYSLEGALSDLEDCARDISSSTTETELAFLEDQVATAAAQVQQSELQISDIEARISALKTAGLNVTPCTRFSKNKSKPMSQTLDSSRHQRRKLPAPPLRSLSSETEVKSEPQVRSMRP